MGLRDPSDPLGRRARPDDRGPGGADLPDHELRLGDTQRAANLFALAEIGNVYTRIMNPTQAVLEAWLNSLEGGCTTAVGLPGTLAVGSGQAAATLAVLNLGGAGTHIVSSSSLYGGTYNLFHYTFPKLGVDVTSSTTPTTSARGGPPPRRTRWRSSARRSRTRRTTSSTSRAWPASPTMPASR